MIYNKSEVYLSDKTSYNVWFCGPKGDREMNIVFNDYGKGIELEIHVPEKLLNKFMDSIKEEIEFLKSGDESTSDE